MKRNKLEEARTRKNWTRAIAAEKLGIDLNTLYRWESGKTTPRGYNRQKLCEVYGKTTIELGLDSGGDDEASQLLVQVGVQNIEQIETLIANDLTMRLMSLAFNQHQNYQIVQSKLTRMVEEHDMVNEKENNITRRDALRRLVSLPLITLQLSDIRPVLIHPQEDILTQCAASIASCWELSKSTDDVDLNLAFKGVSFYLPTLRSIAQTSLWHRKEAASLVGQCELLRTLLGWHLQGLKEAAMYAREAVKYTTEARDRPMLLSTLDYLAWVYYYDNKPREALKTIEQAIPLIKQKGEPVSSNLLSGVYSTLALMTAKNGLNGEMYLRQAEQSFYSPSEVDTRAVHMDYNKGDLLLNNGMIYYHQHDYGKAAQAFDKLIDDELKTKVAFPERSRIEALNIMALTSLKSKGKDMERILHIWDTAMFGAKHLQSEQRYHEALIGYEIMDAIWGEEKPIIERRELSMHW